MPARLDAARLDAARLDAARLDAARLDAPQTPIDAAHGHLSSRAGYSAARPCRRPPLPLPLDVNKSNAPLPIKNNKKGDGGSSALYDVVQTTYFWKKEKKEKNDFKAF